MSCLLLCSIISNLLQELIAKCIKQLFDLYDKLNAKLDEPKIISLSTYLFIVNVHALRANSLFLLTSILYVKDTC